MRLSVVIPVLGDHAELALLIERLCGMTDRPDEIIVVDGAGSAACRKLVAQSEARYVASTAGRGRQLAAGAAQADGAALWFLHADTEPPADGPAAIRRALAGGLIGGWFRFRFSGPPGWHKRCLATLINWRTRVGVPYGDQGLFMLADAYHRAGGFPDQPLFEELPLIRELRRLGRFEGLPISIGVSPRRWERDGWLRRSLANRMLATGYAMGVSPGTLARLYRPMGKDHKGPADADPHAS